MDAGRWEVDADIEPAAEGGRTTTSAEEYAAVAGLYWSVMVVAGWRTRGDVIGGDGVEVVIMRAARQHE